jgi:hypothetical protein
MNSKETPQPFNNVYNDILAMYSAPIDNGSYQWATKPFFINNLAIGLNPQELVFFDKKLADDLDNCTYEFPEKIIDMLTFEFDENLEIDIKFIKKAIEQIPLNPCYDTIGKDIQCTECDGDGEVEWKYKKHYKHFNCPNCKGTGLECKSRQVPNGKFIREEFHYIDIRNSRFNINHIEKMIIVSELTKSPITLIYQEQSNNKYSIFKIGDIYVLIVHCYKKDNHDSSNVICEIK